MVVDGTGRREDGGQGEEPLPGVAGRECIPRRRRGEGARAVSKGGGGIRLQPGGATDADPRTGQTRSKGGGRRGVARPEGAGRPPGEGVGRLRRGLAVPRLYPRGD